MDDPKTPLSRYPSFIRFWWSRVAGTGGNQMLMVAVGWQMYELTGSALDLGLVGLLQFAPALALVLVAGHVVDRHHRGRIAAACMAVQACTALLLALAAHQGFASRTLLLGISVLLGTIRAFQMPAQQALAPLLVPPEVLPRALAFSSAGTQTAILIGPALGGALHVAGSATVYACCAVLFVIGTVLAAGIRFDHTAAAREPASLEVLLAGVRFIRSRPAVLGAISLDLFAVLLGGATALLPIFAKDILATGPEGLGLLRAAPAAGALAMSAWLAWHPVQRRAGRVLLGSVAVYGVATLAFGLSTSFALSMLALAISGGADMVSVVIRQSLVQLDTPDAMRGRVSAVNAVFIGASNQLGEFESGLTAAWFGPVGSVAIGGIGSVAIALIWARLFPTLARRDTLREAA